MSFTQSWPRFQYSRKVGIEIKDVGSPSKGNTRKLNAAFPPMGERKRALATVKSHWPGKPQSKRQSRLSRFISSRTANQRLSRSCKDNRGSSNVGLMDPLLFMACA